MAKLVYVGLFVAGLTLFAFTATGCSSMDKDGCGACSGCGGCGGCSAGCSGGCGGCGCGGGAASSSNDARHAMTLMRQYPRWTKANATQFKSKPHKGMITDYVNAAAAKTFRAGKGNYRPGAVIAKESWKNGKVDRIFLMEKRGSGYDKENGDWWYATLSASGKVMNSGKVEMCIGCHANADNDYIFGVPK